MTEMVYGAVPRQSGDAILPKWWRTVDLLSIACVLGLFAIGLLLALAASVPLAERNGFGDYHYVQRQMVFGVTAIIVMLIVSMLSLTLIRRLAVLGCGIGILALLLLPVLGTDFGKGATRWYSLGFASVQPSEFLKPCFVVTAAWLLAASQQINGPPGRLWSFVLCMLIAALLIIQPDFGQACLVIAAWAIMYFIGGAPMLLLVIMAGLVVLGGTLAYTHSEHFARRIDGYLSTEIDPTTQIGYATNAIREGGLFGVGIGGGQVKFWLPDAHTDFIIAVAAEEYGLVLVVAIILLFATVVIRSLSRLMKERDAFHRIAGTGLACMFGLQAFINMGVAVRLLPAKGMTLPFVSYGGSSLIAGGIALGVLFAMTRRRPQGRYHDFMTGTARA
ncbi:MAG: cell division protein FtsW [Rhodobacteraceae bacterium]|nr:cell division protein FtsW [Paracoccaceae bacterium]